MLWSNAWEALTGPFPIRGSTETLGDTAMLTRR